MFNIRFLVLAMLILIGNSIQAQKRLDPEPVPPLPAPPIQPPPVILSEIRLPVTSNVPDLSIVDDEVCSLYKGHLSYIDILPPIAANADFEIWRDKPLNISFSGNTLTASMHAYYWLVGEVSVVGIPIFGQCGTQGPGFVYGDEETREVIVTMDSRIKWHPDWRIATQTSVRPFNNINRCVVTRRRLDITDHFNKAGEGYLRSAATKFDQRIGELSNFNAKARDMWIEMQKPIGLGANTWLSIQPVSAGAGEINVTNSQPQLAQTVFGLTAEPKIIIGNSPSPTTNPFPALEPLAAGPDGFHVVTDAEMAFEEANRIINDPATGIIGATFQSGRRELKITGARIYGSGSKLAVELSVEGRAFAREGTQSCRCRYGCP
ncbi:MAG: DUF4403 family protein [Pyrinomonadaceae bacterium]